jgi:hypothetical protein
MAEVVRPKFDVVRGWAGGTLPGSAYDRVFEKIVDDAGDPAKIKQGTFVTYSDVVVGAVTPVTAAAGDPSDFVVFLVVEGNDPEDSYSGDYLDKVVAIKGDYEVLLSEPLFDTGPYAVGLPVSFTAGKVNLHAGAQPKMGYVTGYDTASKLLQVAFNL